MHQAYLSAHLTPFDRSLQIASQQASQALQYRGASPAVADHGGLGVLYGNLMKQATMISFNDAFHLLSVMMICILPLVLLMKRVKEGGGPGAEGMH